MMTICRSIDIVGMLGILVCLVWWRFILTAMVLFSFSLAQLCTRTMTYLIPCVIELSRQNRYRDHYRARIATLLITIDSDQSGHRFLCTTVTFNPKITFTAMITIPVKLLLTVTCINVSLINSIILQVEPTNHCVIHSHITLMALTGMRLIIILVEVVCAIITTVIVIIFIIMICIVMKLFQLLLLIHPDYDPMNITIFQILIFLFTKIVMAIFNSIKT